MSASLPARHRANRATKPHEHPCGVLVGRSSRVPSSFGPRTVSGSAAGSASFTVQVTDNGGLTGTQSLSITVVTAGFAGTAPARGSIALLVARGGGTASTLTSALGAAGCTVESLAVLRNGTWLIYVAGAPAVVNASFPASVADLTPFFVRCR